MIRSPNELISGLLAAVIMVTLLAALGGARAQDPTRDDAVVARVDGDSIWRSELTRRLGGKLSEVPPQRRQRALESLILEKILRHRVARLGEAADPAALQATVADTLGQLRGQEADSPGSGASSLARALAAQGVSQEELEANLMLMARLRAHLEGQARNAPAALTGGLSRAGLQHGPTARWQVSTLRHWLWANRHEYADVRVRARLLTIAVGPHRPPQDALEKAAELSRRAREGASFEALVRNHSDDPAAPFTGGDLNFFSRHHDIPEPLASAAFALKPGEVSDPIRSQRGFVVLQVTGRREPPLPAFEKLRDQVSDDWLRLHMLETLNRWRREATVTIEGA